MGTFGKILLTIFIGIALFLVFGAIESKFFAWKTFLSEPRDCMPSVSSAGKQNQQNESLRGKIFGYRCVSY